MGYVYDYHILHARPGAGLAASVAPSKRALAGPKKCVNRQAAAVCPGTILDPGRMIVGSNAP